jgi:hypothetical protein
METMTPTDVVAHYGEGNTYKAAAALGLTPQTLYNWLKEEWVPLGWQGWIERDTAGRLKGDHRRPNLIAKTPPEAPPQPEPEIIQAT